MDIFKIFRILIRILLIVFVLIFLFELICIFLIEHERIIYKTKQGKVRIRPVSYKTYLKNYFSRYIFLKSDKLKNELYVKNLNNLQYNTIYHYKYKKAENIYSKKLPFLIFGCCYAYGSGLSNNQNFSHWLSLYANSPVYNRSYQGRGIQYMLYQLEQPSFYDIVPKPRCIIYVFTRQHFKLLHVDSEFCLDSNSTTIFYKNKIFNGKNILIEDKTGEFIKTSPIYYYFYYKIKKPKTRKISKSDIELAKSHFIQSKNQADKHWNENIKFAILLYDNPKSLQEYKKDFLSLEESGIDVIDANELLNQDCFNQKYKISKINMHPNSRFWQEITPLIIKRLDLY